MRNILNVNKVLDKTYDFYRQCMKTLIAFTALMTLITTSIMYGVMLVVGLVFVLIFGIGIAVSGASGPDSYGWIVLIMVIAVIVMVPAVSIMEMVAAGPICALEIDAKGKKVTFGTMMNYSFQKIGYIITATMACSLGYLLICAVGGGIYYLLYVVALSNLVLVAQIIITALFGLVMLVPLLWYGVISSLFLPVALCEKRHFLGAVIGSYSLVKGQFKRIFGMLFSYMLSFTIIYSSLGGLSSVLINLLTGIFTGMSQSGWIVVLLLIAQFITMLVQLAVTVVISPIRTLTVPIIYFNERNRRFGDDLNQRLDGLILEQQSLIG